jgi:hypothetical protein
MPAFLLHVGATVLCAHAGQAQPTIPNPRVLVSGQPTVLLTAPYVIAGCGSKPPCATGQWVMGAARVMSNGIPVLLQNSQAVCAPTGTGLFPAFTQSRVTGT